MKALLAWWQFNVARAPRRLWDWFARNVALRLLPSRIAYWCAIRVWAWATTGKYGREHAPSVKFDLALGRFERDHRLGYGILKSRGKGRGFADLELLAFVMGIALIVAVAVGGGIVAELFASDAAKCADLCGPTGVRRFSNAEPFECECREPARAPAAPAGDPGVRL